MDIQQHQLPMFPVWNGFVLSGLLFLGGFWPPTADWAWLGLPCLVASLALKMIVDSENETIRDRATVGWDFISADAAENEAAQREADRAAEVESGFGDLEGLKRQNHAAWVSMRSMSLFVGALLAYGIYADWDLIWIALCALLPVATWTGHWGVFRILSAQVPEASDLAQAGLSTAAGGAVPGMGSNPERRLEVYVLMAATFYGILGGGPATYLKAQRALKAGAVKSSHRT